MLNRILFSDNGTLTDYTKELNNYHSDTAALTFTADEDAIYISSELPFNHLYFDVTGAASTAVDYTISIWDGTAFDDVVDVIDETDGFTQSGFITWTPDQDEGWAYDDTEDMTDLSSVKIYKKYWIKISLESSDSMTLNWLGNLFTNDDDLADSYPDLNSTASKTSFKTGKTTWFEQHIVVARDIINKLKYRGTIVDRAQILERRQLIPAACHRLAELIFNHFGDAFRDQRDDDHKAFLSALSDVKLIEATGNTAIPAQPSGVTSAGELYR